MVFNRIFLFALALNVFSISFAAETRSGDVNKNVRELYNELLSIQSHFHLNEMKDQLNPKYIVPVRSSFFKPILEEASKTGIDGQYRKIMRGAVNMKKAQALIFHHYLPSIFCTSSNLRIIACLQNNHGQDGPSTYSVTRNLETEPQDYHLLPGEGNPFYWIIGTFISPKTKKSIVVTQYSFFNGLIDTIMRFQNDPEYLKNNKFMENIKDIKTALIKAIAESKYRLYAKYINNKIKSDDFTTSELNEIIRAMEKVLN